MIEKPKPSENADWIDFVAFRPIFAKIREDFGFGDALEIEARDQLWDLMGQTNPRSLVQSLLANCQGKKICFFGAGPNLTPQLEKLSKQFNTYRKAYFIVAADGSANALQSRQILPDLIISDFDGLNEDQLGPFLDLGVVVSLLVHGDNMSQILRHRNFFQSYTSQILGTTQAPAKYPIINPGGFTDGDRGLFLLHHLLSPTIPFYLLGYEYGSTIGQYSKNAYTGNIPMTPLKEKKLVWCKRLISLLDQEYHRPIFYMGKDLPLEALSN